LEVVPLQMLSTRTNPPVTAPITGAEQTGYHHERGDRSPTSISNACRTARETQFVTKMRLGNGDRLFLDLYQRAHTIELDSYRDKSRPKHSKYLHSVHTKLHRMINEKVAVLHNHSTNTKGGP
jgi:hypothetical protein